MTATIPTNETAAYQSVAALINSLVSKFFTRTHPDHRDRDEMLSEAQLAWLEAHRTFDPTKAKYTTWVGFKVLKALQEKQRQGPYRFRRPRVDIPDNLEKIYDFRDRIPTIMKEVSADSQLILELLVDCPFKVITGNGSPERKQNRLVRFLRRMGWAWDRITESFNEIREALYSK